MENYSIVDYVKFIFAICVVGIHASIWDGGYIYPLLFRLAVPYFFIASGFFIGKKLFAKDSKDFDFKWHNIIKRLIIKLAVFEPLSIILIVIQLKRQGLVITDIVLDVTKHIVFYPYGALWYIQALIVAILILIPFIKIGKLALLFFISFLTYLIALACNNYYFLTEKIGLHSYIDLLLNVIISPRNGLLVGLYYVTTGMLIAKYHYMFFKNKTNNWIFFCFSFIAILFEAIWLKGKSFTDDGGLYLSYVIAIPFLFIITTMYKGENLYSPKLFRNLSTSIYLIHKPIIMIFISMGVQILGFRFPPLIVWIATVGITSAICAVIYSKRKQPFFNWLT